MTATTESTAHGALLHRLRRYLQQYYDLDERIRAFEERRFYSLEVELTNRCNLECRYCYNSSSKSCRIPDLPFEFATRLLTDATEAGVRQISWLGGEPLLYPHLQEVLEASHLQGIENVLFTNGVLLTPKRWRDIGPLVDRVVFHLDTIDADTFVTLSSTASGEGRRMLDQIVRNLQNLVGTGFDRDRVYFYVVLTRPTLERLEETLQFAMVEMRLGTTAVFPMVSAGRAHLVDRAWNLDRARLRQAYELRSQIEGRSELLLLGPSEYCKHYQLTMAYVDVRGYLMPYAGVTRPKRNLRTENLEQVLSQDYAELSFANLVCDDEVDSLVGRCRICPNASLCFGTRTTAFNATGSVCDSDPACWW